MIYQRLVDANPTSIRFAFSLAGCLHNIGLVLEKTQKVDQALATFERARAISQSVVPFESDRHRAPDFLANHHDAIGSVLLRTGKREAAHGGTCGSPGDPSEASRCQPHRHRVPITICGSSHGNVGVQLRQSGKLADTLAARKRRHGRSSRSSPMHNPDVTEYRATVAFCENEIGVLLLVEGKLGQALGAGHNEALTLLQRLAEANPGMFDYQREVGMTLTRIGTVRSALKQFPDAIAAFKRAVAIQERLMTVNPAVTDYQDDLAWACSGLGRTTCVRPACGLCR